MKSSGHANRERQVLQPEPGDALLVVDVQVDFLPAGALPVPEGGDIVPVLNRYLDLFESRKLPTIFTRDAHPANHCSFQEQGGPWPVHCVEGTSGAAFAPGLRLPSCHLLVSKARRAEREEYSGFDTEGLKSWIEHLRIRRVWVGGLATEYCVRGAALDAIRQGLEVVLLLDAIRGVNVRQGDDRRAIEEMVSAGAITARWTGTCIETCPHGAL